MLLGVALLATLAAVQRADALPEAPEPGALSAPSEIRSVPTGGLETRAAALLLSAQRGGDLATAAAAYARAGGAELVLDLDPAPLVERLAAGEPLIVEVYAYALDAEGVVRGALTEAFLVDDARAALAGRGVKLVARLPLAAGAYSVRVLTVDRRADRFALDLLALEVTELADPVPLEPAEPWLLVRPAGDEASGPPWSFAGRRWLPAARPVLVAGAPTPFLLPDRPVTAQLLDPERSEEPLRLPIEPRAADPTGGRAIGELPPSGLTPGEYLLALEPADEPPVPEEPVPEEPEPEEPAAENPVAATLDGRSSSRREPLRVVVAAAPAIWIELGESAEVEALSEPIVRAGAGGPRALAAGYVAALRALAGDEPDPAAARAAVAVFERRALGDGGPRSTAQLAGAELSVARQADVWSGTESSPPLVLLWLHEGLYREYHRRGEYRLAVHARTLVAQLGELTAQRSPGSDRARRALAAALVSMAGYLQQIGANLEAEQTFEAALAHDREQPAALLGLAVLREAYGRYPEAVALLERLARQRPDDLEVRLRLGVNRRRTGARKAAAKTLRGCLGAGAPRWVRSIAFQQLAELEAERGDRAAAVELLRRALAELPEDGHLTIQLAAQLDELGEPAQASALLAGLGASPARPSARLRYGDWPRAYVLAARRGLEAEAHAELPALVALLDRLERHAEGVDEGEER